MKIAVRLLIIVAVAVAVLAYSDNKFGTNMLNLGTMTTSDGKYTYKKINKNTLNYIKKFDNGRLYENRMSYDKVFLYTYVKGTSCPYRRNFQKKMKNYEASADWTKKYYFIKHEVEESQSMQFNSMQDFEDFKSFNNDCDFFCIINFNKNAIYSGKKNSDEFVYSVLYSFYND